MTGLFIEHDGKEGSGLIAGRCQKNGSEHIMEVSELFFAEASKAVSSVAFCRTGLRVEPCPQFPSRTKPKTIQDYVYASNYVDLVIPTVKEALSYHISEKNRSSTLWYADLFESGPGTMLREILASPARSKADAPHTCLGPSTPGTERSGHVRPERTPVEEYLLCRCNRSRPDVSRGNGYEY